MRASLLQQAFKGFGLVVWIIPTTVPLCQRERQGSNVARKYSRLVLGF